MIAESVNFSLLTADSASYVQAEPHLLETLASTILQPQGPSMLWEL